MGCVLVVTFMERVNVSSGTPWEISVGYSRAVRVGQFVFVSGTAPADEKGNIIGVGDPYAQTKYILEKIQKALEKVGAGLKDVTRSRAFVTDISRWEQIGKAHSEFFKNVKPALTMVEVKSLIRKEVLVEIEVDAIIT